MINASRLLNNFLELVRIDSITYEEKDLVDYLLTKVRPLSGAGVTARTDDAGFKIGGNSGNLIITIPGKVSVPAILLNAHLDTVEPGRGILPKVNDNIIASIGDTILGADDKVGVAALLELLLCLAESGAAHGPVEIVFTVAEEKGLLGAKNLDFSALKSRQAYVFDSAAPVGRLTVRAPFQDSIKVVYLGKAAHAGISPESGVNAIVAAANAIARMNLGRIDAETTANVGVIKGGRASNIIPDEVEIKAEARSLSKDKLEEQTAHMIEIFEQAGRDIGARVGVEVEREYDGFDLEKDHRTVATAAEAARSIGLEPVMEPTGGGADTNVFNSNGLAAVGLGVGYIQPHSSEESVAVDQLEKAARLAAAIVQIAAKR